MNRYLALLPILLFSASCTAQETPSTATTVLPVDSHTLVKCAYKYDSRQNVQFLKHNKVEHRIQNLSNLLTYRITDVNGKKWVVNEYDMQNYTCTETLLPKG